MLVLFALLIVFFVTLVAFAVDLGQGRFQKRDTQATADLAGLAAGFYLSGSGSGSPAVSQPAKACEAALNSIATNTDDFTPVAGAAAQCAARFPANALTCTTTTPAATLEINQPPYIVRITYPVPEDMLTSSQFTGVGLDDGTSRCQRMGVDVRRSTSTSFAGVIGQDELVTNVGAVVRGAVGTGDGAPAFLMLERTDCGTLWNSANGAGNLGIIVENNGTDQGIIHSDSNATTSCSGNTTDAFAIYGSPLSDGTPSIKAFDGSGGKKGIISAVATNGKGAATFPGGLSVAPTVGTVYSRKYTDQKYNSGTSKAITDLHGLAAPLVNGSGQPAGTARMACNGNITQASPASQHLYVDCDNFNQTVDFAGFTQVTFSGSTDVKQDNVLTFPNATRVVVRGALAIPKGRVVLPLVQELFIGGGISVTGNSGLAVNSTSESTCVGREGFASGVPVWTNTTKVAVFGGSYAFDASGPVALCQTTMYFAGPKSLTGTTHIPQQTETGGTCAPDLPCPKTVGNVVGTAAQFYLSGTIYWSAPNQHQGKVPDGVPQGVEDLAMWTEGSGTSEIRSGGTVYASGVFFAPNTSYEIRSPASGLPRDAQFIARRLSMLQGTLRMKPDKNNAITVPTPGGYGLIR